MTGTNRQTEQRQEELRAKANARELFLTPPHCGPGGEPFTGNSDYWANSYVHPLALRHSDDGWWLDNTTIPGLPETIGPFASEKAAKRKRKELVAQYPEARKCKRLV